MVLQDKPLPHQSNQDETPILNEHRLFENQGCQ